MIPNKQKKIFYFCIYLGIFFAFVVLLSILFFDSIGELASPIIFLSIWLSVSSFGVSLLFKKRAKNLDDAISNSEIIAEFDYTEKEWEKFKKSEKIIRNEERNAAFKILTIITIIIFISFILIIPEAKLIMAFVGIALIIFYAIMAFAVPFIISKCKRKENTKIVIMGNGVLINDQYHTWDFPLSKLRKVSVEKKPFEHLSIIYSFYDRLGPRNYNIILPIKNKTQAENIVNKLKKVNKI